MTLSEPDTGGTRGVFSSRTHETACFDGLECHPTRPAIRHDDEDPNPDGPMKDHVDRQSRVVLRCELDTLSPPHHMVRPCHATEPRAQVPLTVVHTRPLSGDPSHVQTPTNRRAGLYTLCQTTLPNLPPFLTPKTSLNPMSVCVPVPDLV